MKKLVLLLLISVPILAQDFVGSSTGVFSTAKAADPVFSPATGYTGAPTNVTLTCSTPGCVICYAAYPTSTPGVQPLPTAQTPGICDASTLTYTAPIPINITSAVAALVTAPGYANSNADVGPYVINAAAINFVAATPFSNGAGVGSTIVGPSTGSTNCNTPTMANFAILPTALAITTLTASAVNDNIQGSAVQYSKLAGTPTSTSEIQLYYSTLSFNNPTIVWAVVGLDSPSAASICLNGFNHIDGSTTTVASNSASSFTLPSITPTYGGEFFLAACTDESTSIGLTTSSSGWSAVTGFNASASNYIGLWYSYKVKASGDTAAESPVFTSSGNIGASCIMVAIR